MEIFIVDSSHTSSNSFEEKRVTSLIPQSFLSGRIINDKDSEFYPNRGDEKIMRSETIAALILVNQLIQKYKSKLSLDETGLFVASGVFIENLEKHLGHIVKFINTIKESSNEKEKYRKIYFASPPLLALQTLTNSTMSFIAQYSGIKGNNATYGNTSLSGFHAIEEACDEAYYNNREALACASNCAGEYSFLVHSPFFNSSKNWKESAAAGALLLSSKIIFDSKYKITALKYSTNNDYLNSNHIERNWKKLLPDLNADALIFSGAFTEEINLNDLLYCKKLNPNSISIFDTLGNMGPANLFASINKGIELLKSGLKKIDIVDSDVFGRESLIRIETI